MTVTGRRQEFIDALEPGDVLLFQGADFLAGLAQLTERRTAYHSSIYLGHRVLAHNVSSLWWRDAARRGPDGVTLEPVEGDDKLPVDWPGHVADLRANLAYTHLVDLDGHPDLAHLSDLHEKDRVQHARELLRRGGVGAITIDSYLDRHNTEWLYSNPLKRDAANPVHHVRSVVALRHHLADPESPASMAKVSKALLDAVEAAAGRATTFDAAELVSFIPDIADRPGYPEWSKLRKEAEHNRFEIAVLLRIFPIDDEGEKSARKMVRERLGQLEDFPPNPGGPGWICASFVDHVYARAGLPLDLEKVEEVYLGGAQVPLSTPRDLWDATTLTPIALLARGPERWGI